MNNVHYNFSEEIFNRDSLKNIQVLLNTVSVHCVLNQHILPDFFRNVILILLLLDYSVRHCFWLTANGF